MHAYRDDLKDSEDNTIDMVKAAIKKKFTESGNITATCHRMEDKVTAAPWKHLRNDFCLVSKRKRVVNALNGI